MSYLRFLITYYKNFLKVHYKKYQSEVNEQFKNIGILNPTIGSSNLGDLIIYESVNSYLRTIFRDDMFTDFPTQLFTSFDAMKLMNQRDLLFIAGTNLLSSNLESYHQWKIHSGHKKFLENKVVLLGCGWWQYQNEVNNYTKSIYKKILCKDVLHSVRDQYSVDKLNNVGINNVLNTSCPTLWCMTPEQCELIPKTKAEEVVTTLTHYYKNVKLDKRMLTILSQNYDRVYLWIQGMDDFFYFKEINVNADNIVLVPPTIDAYNSILKLPSVDYVGTRLHAGARALQNNIRTLILAVDNRALEIGRDVNLNVIKREYVDDIIHFIQQPYTTKIKLPIENIENWKKSQLLYKNSNK